MGDRRHKLPGLLSVAAMLITATALAEDVGGAIHRTAEETGAAIEKTARETGSAIQQRAAPVGDAVKKTAEGIGPRVETGARETGGFLDRGTRDFRQGAEGFFAKVGAWFAGNSPPAERR